MTAFSEQQATAAVARRLEEDGYVVTIEPNLKDIPFELEGYRPDILAVKRHEHVIVEVKRSGRRLDTAKYQQVADKATKAGWVFKLVTVPEQFRDSSPQREAEFEKIRPFLVRIDELLAQPRMEAFAMASLWNVYVTCLQLLLERDSPAQFNRSDLGLINLAYTLGILSFEEFTQAKSHLAMRNHAVHSLNVEISRSDVMELRAQVQSLFERLLRPEAPQKPPGNDAPSST